MALRLLINQFMANRRRDERSRKSQAASQLLLNVLDYWFESVEERLSHSLSSLVGSSVSVERNQFRVLNFTKYFRYRQTSGESFTLYSNAYSSNHPPLLAYSPAPQLLVKQIEKGLGCQHIKDQIFLQVLRDHLVVLADLTHKKMPLNLVDQIVTNTADFDRFVSAQFRGESLLIHLQLMVTIYGRRLPIHIICAIPPALSCGELGNIT